jgi:hypothetical protein
MALGSLKFRGIGLGTAGVLFAGILVGHFGEAVDPSRRRERGGASGGSCGMMGLPLGRHG